MDKIWEALQKLDQAQELVKNVYNNEKFLNEFSHSSEIVKKHLENAYLYLHLVITEEKNIEDNDDRILSEL